MFECGNSGMLSNPKRKELFHLFGFNSILFVVPPEFFEIKVDKITQILFARVDTANNQHIPPKKSGWVTSPRLYTLFIVHFETPSIVIKQIYKKYSVVTVSCFPTFVVVSHTTENHCESIFVQDCGMVTSGPFAGDSFHPAVLGKRKYIDGAERITTMASNKDSLIFINDESVTFPGFRFPPIDFERTYMAFVQYVLWESFLHSFLHNFTNLGVHSG